MSKLYFILGIGALLVVSFPVVGSPPVDSIVPDPNVTGEKRDSGPGSVTPYGQWTYHPELQAFVRPAADRVSGEKLDSGLGALPPYDQWAHHPELQAYVRPPALRLTGEKPEHAERDLRATAQLR
jgi:hypothetical protein